MIKTLQILFKIRRWLYGRNLFKSRTQVINGALADGRPVIIVWKGSDDVHLHDDYPVNGYVKMYTKSKDDYEGLESRSE